MKGEKQNLEIKLNKLESSFAKEKLDHENAVSELKALLTKRKRAVEKQKAMKEELNMKVQRLESEKATLNALLNSQKSENRDLLDLKEDLESKNAKLRKEILRIARERNDAESIAKEK
jgi:chromosome segregation ATPase